MTPLQTLIAFAECAVKTDPNSAILTGADDHNPPVLSEAALRELPSESPSGDVVFRDSSAEIIDFNVSNIILSIIFFILIFYVKIIIYID